MASPIRAPTSIRDPLLRGAMALLLAAACSQGSANVPRNTGLNRQSHGAFPIAGGSHGNTDCNACHGDFDTFAQFTCLSSGCHPDPGTSARHSGIPDYAYASDRCYACHRNGKGEFDLGGHDRSFFPITAAQKHGSVGCAECHTSATDRKVLTCDACHSHPASEMPTKHGAVSDFASVATQCLRCHAESQVDRVAAHLPLKLTSGAPHAPVNCFSCHAQMRSDRAWAADFSAAALNCLTGNCHAQPATDAQHAGTVGYTWDSASCARCHPDGTANFDHTAFFPIAASAKHTGIGCAECHTNPADRKVLTCDACHSHAAADMPAKHTVVSGFANHASECVRCHADSQVDRVESHLPFRINAGSAHDQAECFSCHPGMRADKRWAADFSQGSLNCLTGGCHAKPATDGQHSGVAGYAWDTTSCIGCHPDGTSNIDHTKYFPIAPADQHASIGCADCHTSPANRKVLTCDACHSHPASSMPTAHAAVYNYANLNAPCIRCHAESQVNRVASHLPFRIGSSTAHRQSTCFDCHPAMRTDKTWATDFSAGTVDCLRCHTRSNTDSHHREVSGYQYLSTSCIRSNCHADGQTHDN